MALPFPRGEGEVGCEALSSSQHEQRQSNNMRADDTETPPAGHAETASDKQSNAAKIFHIAASACNIRAGRCAQCSTSSGYQSITLQNAPTTCNAASKRKARSESPRSRGPAGILEFYRAAGKSCFYTSNLHSRMHSATGFQNLTHLGQTRESQK